MYIWQYTSSSYGVLFQSVAVSTMRRRSARPEAFLHAKERPMFRGLRSASTEHNQVWLGLPAGLLQSGRGLRIAAESTTSTSPSATWTVGHGAGLPNWIILVLDQLIWSPKAAASSCNLPTEQKILEPVFPSPKKANLISDLLISDQPARAMPGTSDQQSKAMFLLRISNELQIDHI